ncbi:Potassium voltage-gated channel subfamily B member 1 [Aphelenchoides fujianensis]|nr:Potassium voltage-gated channel subfamily B member 1 [Aphelenchoides fujianensis]
MNTAVLQGSIIATSHGIQRINRHNREAQTALRTTERIGTFLARQKPKRSTNLEAPSGEHDDELASSARSDLDSSSLRNQGFLSALAKQTHDLRLLNVDAYFEKTREYYFERTAAHFPVIYQFYTTGKIHQASHLCPQDLIEELHFYRLNPEKLVGLCSCTAEPMGEDESELQSILDESDEEEPGEFENIRFGKLRQKIWRLVEEPSSSMAAQVFAAISVLFVLASISGLVLGSIPELQVPSNHSDLNSSLPVEMEPHPLLIQLENVCIVWFASEYLTKMIVTPRHWKQFTRVLNLIDLFAILPFVMEMILWLINVNAEQLRDLKSAFLKLGRYSSGLQMFGKTLKASSRQLLMMGMVVSTGVVLFASLLYFTERDDPTTEFVSIPAACWFSVVTMTTVGYGDMTPSNRWRKADRDLRHRLWSARLVAEAERRPVLITQRETAKSLNKAEADGMKGNALANEKDPLQP